MQVGQAALVGAAAHTARQVAVDEVQVEARILVVEQGRQRFTALFASHGPSVVSAGPRVPALVAPAPDLPARCARLPGVESAGVDPVTRLALGAARGDGYALDGFVRATQADVWRCCAHLVAPEAADDLTQETYLRLVTALRSFRGDASGRTFVLSIARRVCFDEIRRRTRRRALADRLWRRRPPALEDASATSALEALVDQLEPDRRAAFVLTQLLGLSYEEAAVVCECAVGTIRSRVSRARQVLIDALDDTPEQSEDASG
jgi:RNA polymerase sigma-70 factor (ECF subfamily)